MKYKHLTATERELIAKKLRLGLSIRAIAQALERSPSSISREIRRNSLTEIYAPETARLAAEKRARNCRNAKTISAETWVYVVEKLQQKHSPEQISGVLKNRLAIVLSHSTIYRYIHADKRNGGKAYKHLRGANKRRKSYGAALDGRGKIPARVDISKRPKSVETRDEIGDWEGDTVVGAHHLGAVVTLVERKTGYAVIAKVADRTAKSVTDACIKALSACKMPVKSITFDNGKEFSHHQEISQAIDTKIYFSKPHSPWQRGCNENFNGLLRQYLPKKMPFATVTQEQLNEIMNEINARPRKRLGYYSPLEMFQFYLTNPVALR
jgi:IS30 family transposase